MPNELQDTWNEIATKWDKWQPPLRPNSEDIQIMKDAIASWSQGKESAKAVLLGVTPEIANLEFPIPTKLLAIDNADQMIKLVWPGDNDNRKAVLGNWLNYELPEKSQDIILADGSLVFFGPQKINNLIQNLKFGLKQDGLFIARCFIKGNIETPIDVLRSVKSGDLTNFHEFKFRLAMALQLSFEAGVNQGKIWTYGQQLSKVPNNFSEEDKNTLNAYQNKAYSMHFPTREEIVRIFESYFTSVQVVYPNYNFGICCPTIIAKSLK